MKTGSYLEHFENWPMPVVPIPLALNPFTEDGVELFAIPACHLPDENIKSVTVAGIMDGLGESGALEGVDRFVEASSGNFGKALVSEANRRKISTTLVVMPDLPQGKLAPLQMAGATIIPPEEGLSAIATARKLGGGGWKNGGVKPNGKTLNVDQYGNPNGLRYHENFTAKKILHGFAAQFPPDIYVGSVGTGGTILGVGQGLRHQLGGITIWGVFCGLGQEIPGCRDKKRIKEVTLIWDEAKQDFTPRWHQVVDQYTDIATRPCYLAATWFNLLCGMTPGPSSGLAYLGALKLLWQHKVAGTLDKLRGKFGRVRVGILFPDGNRPYGDRFTANLSFDCFNVKTAPLPWQMPGYELW
jgi:cysteine synthase A